MLLYYPVTGKSPTPQAPRRHPGRPNPSLTAKLGNTSGPGGLFMPGFARAHCHGDGTPIRPGASGTKAAADVPPGVSRYPASRLICGRASSAGSGAGSPLSPLAGPLPIGTESTGTRWPVDGQGGQRPRQLGGNSGKMNTLKVRSVVHNRPQSTGEQQVSVGGPAGPYRRSGRPSRCRASTSASKSADQASTPIVWSWVIWRS